MTNVESRECVKEGIKTSKSLITVGKVASPLLIATGIKLIQESASQKNVLLGVVGGTAVIMGAVCFYKVGARREKISELKNIRNVLENTPIAYISIPEEEFLEEVYGNDNIREKTL